MLNTTPLPNPANTNPNYPQPAGQLPTLSNTSYPYTHSAGYDLVPHTHPHTGITDYQENRQTKYPRVNMAAGHILTGNPATSTLQAIMNSMAYGFYIKMRPDYAEMLLGCDRRKMYTVYELDPDCTNPRNIPILECKEITEFCQRKCAPPLCRAIELAFRKISNDPAEETEEVSFKLVKECQCTFLCCNRPALKMYVTENQQDTYFGRSVYKWDCC